MICVKKVKYPASIMVWGCMSASGVGKLHFVEGFVNTEKYIDTMRSDYNEVIFQQDCSPCLTAKKVKTLLAFNAIPLLDSFQYV